MYRIGKITVTTVIQQCQSNWTIFRKSHEVSTRNFDPFGVRLRVEHNPGHNAPPLPP